MRVSSFSRLAVVAVALASSACASAGNPWQGHARGERANALAADLDGICPVVVHNATGQLLEARVDLNGVDRSLGLLAEGASATVGVACTARQVSAKGISQSLGLAEVARYAKTVRLDVTRETSLRLTWADQTRW
ncbi:MAG: hypothetical protein FIA95_00590 [Gemmatimonadetes bacterium]|nr:hypothetical protein [Gemmatimonadota bacterium]